eukprot:14773_1
MKKLFVCLLSLALLVGCFALSSQSKHHGINARPRRLSNYHRHHNRHKHSARRNSKFANDDHEVTKLAEATTKSTHKTVKETSGFVWNHENQQQWKNYCQDPSVPQESPAPLKDSMKTSTLPFHKWENKLVNATLMKLGHTLELSEITSAAPTISLEDGTIYTLAQFHFHWDARKGHENDGSEHKLNDAHSPLEIHFVHFRSGGDGKKHYS